MRAKIAAPFSLLLLLCLLAAFLTGCGSAYDHPEKYVSLPPLSEITLSLADLEKEYDETVAEILASASVTPYEPMPAGTLCQAGDLVEISFRGVCPETALSAATLAALTQTEPAAFTLGNEELPTFLETPLLSHAAGETLTFSHTYREDETDLEELFGKTVDFTLTLHSIKRAFVKENATLDLQYTVSAETEENDALSAILAGGLETVELFDPDDFFDAVFPNAALYEALAGAAVGETRVFSLTMPASAAQKYHIPAETLFTFHVTLRAVAIKPSALTDEFVADYTNGALTTVEAFRAKALAMIREDMAFGALTNAAQYAETLPKKEYEAYYQENYQKAVAATLGSMTAPTEEELLALVGQEVYDRICQLADENTTAELRERLLLEYLFDTLPVSLTEEEYTAMLSDLFNTYIETNYLLLIMNNIGTPAALESYLGRSYLEVQFLYEKALPLLTEQVTWLP